MSNNSREEILHRVRKGLYGNGADRAGAISAGEEGRDFRKEAEEITRHNMANVESMLEQFIKELLHVNTEVKTAKSDDELKTSITELIKAKGISSFAIWESDYLKELGMSNLLTSEGLEHLEAYGKEVIAKAGVGITEVDYAIADTGTLVLLTDGNKPRSVSLLPPIHLALVKKCIIVSNINELFVILKQSLDDTRDIASCMTFITGPSRTADIELNLTLGVHGPKELYVFIMTDILE